MEVGCAWIGRYDTVHAYDVTGYEAGTDTTDSEDSLEGPEKGLMMTRGSDPAEGKSSRS